jgi:hypothetical protein
MIRRMLAVAALSLAVLTSCPSPAPAAPPDDGILTTRS